MHPSPQGMSIKPHLVTVMLSGGGGDEQAMAQARPRKTASDAVLLARIIVDVGMTSPPISPYQDDAERPECPAGILRRGAARVAECYGGVGETSETPRP